MDTPTQRDAILDLMVTNESELTGDTKIGGSLGCRDHTLVESTVLGDMVKVKGIVRTLNFRKVNFQLFKGSVGPPGKWSSKTRGQNRAGRSLRTLSIEHRSSQSQNHRITEWQNGRGWKRPL